MTEQEEAEFQVRAELQELGRRIKGTLPEGYGFVLLVGLTGDACKQTPMMYLSTIGRPDAIQLMREFIAKQKEERNWQRDIGLDELEEELQSWWKMQCERLGRLPLKWETREVKEWCADAFRAGRASA